MAQAEKTKETPAQEAPTGAPAPKKSSALKIVLIIFGVLILLGIIGAVVGGLLIKKAVSTVTGVTTSDGTTTIGSGDNKITVSDNQVWPDSAPSVVPKFTDGNITGTTRIGDYWTITISEVTRAEYNAYKVKLTAAGFVTEEGSEVELDSMTSYSAKKGTYKVTPAYTVSDNSLMITITKVEE
jgi:hypothetical protein